MDPEELTWIRRLASSTGLAASSRPWRFLHSAAAHGISDEREREVKEEREEGDGRRGCPGRSPAAARLPEGGAAKTPALGVGGCSGKHGSWGSRSSCGVRAVLQARPSPDGLGRPRSCVGELATEWEPGAEAHGNVALYHWLDGGWLAARPTRERHVARTQWLARKQRGALALVIGRHGKQGVRWEATKNGREGSIYRRGS
ncbi:hypothetical protein TRIUR3_21882 [Triticum urartu]|uniref:Uncharacterized protein n=1 Tax=Triticum urartu TaxID=4572 RepID=M7ZG49_TRIUA|nr:hypothetical protein TRIUR3_21882 [Triticum urartu]